MKQPWFFYSVIVPKYVELLEVLNSYDEDNMAEIKDFFCCTGFDIKKYTSKCSYKTIVFNSVSNLDDIIETCIYVISHAVEIMSETDVDLRNKCTHVVFQVLNDGILKHKTVCLMYFRKYMTMIRRIDLSTERIILKVVYYAHQTLSRVPLWLDGEDVTLEEVESFKTALLDIFNKYYEFRELYDQQTENHGKICSFSINIIESLVHINNDELVLKKKLVKAIIAFIKAFDSFKMQDYNIILENLGQFPEIIVLIENKMLDQAPNLRWIWKEIYDQALANESSELQIIRQAFVSITNVIHMYKSNNNSISNFHIFNEKLPTILAMLSEKCQSKDLNVNEFFDIMDIFACAMETFQFTHVDSLKIISFIISPFSSDSNIPIAIRKLFISNIFSDNDIRECKIKSIKVMTSFSLKHFGEDKKVAAEQKIWSVFEDIVASNEKFLQKELIKNLLNLILSGKYSAKKIYAGLIAKVIEDPQLYLELTEVFQDLTCLLSQHSIILQTKNNGPGFKYKINCSLCNESIKSVSDDSDQSLDEFDLSQDKGTLIITNEHFKNFESIKKSGKYFLMWLQSDNSAVKINMIRMLRPLILHTGFGKYSFFNRTVRLLEVLYV